MGKVDKIYLGADHGGFELKEKMKGWLGNWGYLFEDCGAFKYNPDDDYPDFAFAAAAKVGGKAAGRVTGVGKKRRWRAAHVFGILGCRSAAGVVIAANKIAGIRAAAAHNIQAARHMREHNDANILAVAGDWLDEKAAKDIIRMFLETEFSFEKRHIRRLRKMEKYATRDK